MIVAKLPVDDSLTTVPIFKIVVSMSGSTKFSKLSLITFFKFFKNSGV